MSKYNKILIILFTIDIIFVFVYIFYLIDIKEFFNKGFELGLLLYNISLSFIAAVIFYLIIDYYPKKERKYKFLRNLEIHLNDINNSLNEVIDNLNYPTNIEKIDLKKINNEVFKEVLKNTPPDFKTSKNYIEYFNQDIDILKSLEINSRKVISNIEEILKHIDFLEPELYKVLEEIKSYPIIQTLQFMKQQNLKIKNLLALHKILINYINLINKLNSEWEQNKK
jgi:hypothetical protein